MPAPPLAAEPSLSNEKQAAFGTLEKVPYSTADVESTTGTDTAVLQTERDIVTHVISVRDDPSLNPWTFRSVFLGILLSAFGGVLGERHFYSKGTIRAHELQRTAEIYYFKPVSNIPVPLVQIKFRSSAANRLRLYHVPRNHQLRTWNCPRSFHSVLGMVLLLEPSTYSLFSLIRFLHTSEIGSFQQERERTHSHNGKRGSKFGAGNRGSCSAAVVLQHHPKRCRIHLPPLLKPASWLRYRGFDEA